MLQEYLEDPNAQVATRVLLLYDLVPDEVGALRDANDRLSRRTPEMSCAFDALPGVLAVDGSSLAATVAEADLGVEPVAGSWSSGHSANTCRRTTSSLRPNSTTRRTTSPG